MKKLEPYLDKYNVRLKNSLKFYYSGYKTKDLVKILKNPAFSETYDAVFEILLNREYFL